MMPYSVSMTVPLRGTLFANVCEQEVKKICFVRRVKMLLLSKDLFSMSEHFTSSQAYKLNTNLGTCSV